MSTTLQDANGDPTDAITNSDEWTPLICVNLTTLDSFLVIEASFSALAVDNDGTFRLTVDGAFVPNSAVYVDVPPGAAAIVNGGAMVRRVAVDPGLHTVCLEWRQIAQGGSLSISALTQPERDHASLVVKEDVCGGAS